MKKLPAVTSLKRCIVITDGVMNNMFADGKATPLDVVRHSVRGTQNIVGDADAKTENKERGVSNIQETDTAKLHPEAVAMRVDFSVRFLPLTQALDACSDNDKKEDVAQAFRGGLNDFIAKATNSVGLREVAMRNARNIANARWLWRNRTIAESIKVNVYVTRTVAELSRGSAGQDDLSLSFSALDVPLNHFDNYSADEIKLGEKIMQALSGSDAISVKVSAEVDFGIKGAIEVFPSQNYIDGKPKGFSRSLYKYGVPANIDKTNNNRVGYAALRDQKIGNALRTIDTWYPTAADRGGVPIAVEPNGANLAQNEFYRKNSSSAFKIFLNLGSLDPSTTDGMFALASLMRGGVFSGGTDDKAEKKDATAEATVEV